SAWNIRETRLALEDFAQRRDHRSGSGLSLRCGLSAGAMDWSDGGRVQLWFLVGPRIGSTPQMAFSFGRGVDGVVRPASRHQCLWRPGPLVASKERAVYVLFIS